MTRTSLVGSLALALALAGCGDSGSSSTGGGAGRLTLLLKDAPADVQAAVVSISEIDLVGDGGQLVLRDTPVTTDLLSLANDTTTLVEGVTIPAGTYTQLRFVITGGYLDVAGTIYASSPDYAGLPAGAAVGGELRMPSYGTSGLKVDLPAGALTLGGDLTTLVVDFDVSRSFGHAAGSSGAWVMHPVVKATAVEQTGAIHASLGAGAELAFPPGISLADFQAALTPAAGGDAVVIPLVDAGDGTAGATFVYLVPGDYLLTFQPPAAVAAFEIDPAVPAPVAVTAGQTTEAAFQLLSLTPVAPPM